jgi:hypothetical protein
MKSISIFFFFVISVSSVALAQNAWRDRPEIIAFLNRIDSTLESSFGHTMEPFDEFEPGALNYVKNMANLPGATEDYIYNEAYAHSCATLPIPFDQIPASFFIEHASEQASDSRTASFMQALNPDKYWVSYYELEGKYYYVLCLGVDREKTYREMGY